MGRYRGGAHVVFRRWERELSCNYLGFRNTTSITGFSAHLLPGTLVSVAYKPKYCPSKEKRSVDRAVFGVMKYVGLRMVFT